MSKKYIASTVLLLSYRSSLIALVMEMLSDFTSVAPTIMLLLD